MSSGPSSANQRSIDISNLNALLQDLDPFRTAANVLCYSFYPEMNPPLAMIEFATLLALSTCKGLRRPSLEDTHEYVRKVGLFYRNIGMRDPKRPLSTSFASHRLRFKKYIRWDQEMAATWTRFEQHEAYLEQKLGFHVANALFFAVQIGTLISERMPKTGSLFPQVVDGWERASRFRLEDIEARVRPKVRNRLRLYLDAFSLRLTELPSISGPLDDSPLYTRPIVRVDQDYVVPVPNYLIEHLSWRLHREMVTDPYYKGRYISQKGRPLEELVHDILSRRFPQRALFRNRIYPKGEADIIVEFGDLLLFFECTSKWISPNSWEGNPNAIQYDLDKSIKKCFLQAKKAKEAYQNGTLKLPLSRNPTKFVTVIVTDESFPNLLLDVLKGNYLKSLVAGGTYPYIISARDLERVLRRVRARKFVDFVDERVAMTSREGGGHILCSDEWDYLKLFLRPDYLQIKRTLIERQANVGFTPKADPIPPERAPLEVLHFIIAALGGGDGQLMDITSPKNVDWAAEMAMRFCYEAYKDWDEVLPHMVFDIDQFNAAVNRCKLRGIRCRVIAWEGMREYLETTDTPQTREFKRKLADESIADHVAVLLPFSKEIPSYVMRERTVGEKLGDLKFFQFNAL